MFPCTYTKKIAPHLDDPSRSFFYIAGSDRYTLLLWNVDSSPTPTFSDQSILFATPAFAADLLHGKVSSAWKAFQIDSPSADTLDACKHIAPSIAHAIATDPTLKHLLSTASPSKQFGDPGWAKAVNKYAHQQARKRFPSIPARSTPSPSPSTPSPSLAPASAPAAPKKRPREGCSNCYSGTRPNVDCSLCPFMESGELDRKWLSRVVCNTTLNDEEFVEALKLVPKVPRLLLL